MKYSESLKKNRDFQLVYKQGTSFANRFLVMYVKKNQLTEPDWNFSKQKGGKQRCAPPSGETDPGELSSA